MKNTRKTFKPYNQNQLMVFPPSFDDLIPADHPVRVVNQIIDQINLDALLENFKGGGCSSYHPRMLLKLLVYGYLCNIYSSRKLEAAAKENIHFMWLTGMSSPDHNTINRFRKDRLKNVIKKIFTQVVLLMSESGHLDLQKVYTDGTKIESSANRYTFVWGKRIKSSRDRIIKQLEELWQYTQEIAKEEMKDTAPLSFDVTDPDSVKRTIDDINEALRDKPIPKEVRQKINYAKKNWPDKIAEYNRDEVVLGARNSYSKTDHDATFMRMKEDHMRNGQLKPGYNVQISTNNQFIVNYTLHQNPTDTRTLIPHVQSYLQEFGRCPEELIADAGYGSEENYEYLDRNNITAFVKYNYFDRERLQRNKPKPINAVESLHYNKDGDYFICPMGQRMNFVDTIIETSETGYKKNLSRYKAQNCQGCPLRGACHKAKGDRVISVNHRLGELKSQARELLLSDQGISHRKKRCVDVEPVFGMIKQNKGFRRFSLKGLDLTSIEFGLIAMSHNLKKLAKLLVFYFFSTKIPA